MGQEMFRKLYDVFFTPFVAVKPTTSDTELFGWRTIHFANLFEAWRDDRRRYGVRVAMHNLWWIIRKRW